MTKVTTHRFAEKTNPVGSDVSPIRRLSDKYAKGLAAAIEQVAGGKVDAVAQDVQFQSFGNWSGKLESLSSFSIFRLLPLRGQLILHLPEEMINNLVELYFGGDLGPAVARSKDGFRDTEIQLIGRLQQTLIDLLVDEFSEYAIMKPALLHHENNPMHLTVCKPDEQIIRQSFKLSIGSDISWDLEWIYSAEAAESTIELLQNKSVETSEAIDPEWQREWYQGLQHIHLPLRTILAQPVMTLPELFEMKPGDVIPITPRVKPPLFVANHKFAIGTLGEKNGCAAFKIEHIERGDRL
ncbi:hypothetical protein GCM10009096_07700 [Parasphingorhabdus litoris]|uniref:Flagellar motor switch protein FliM n=1 Tax=Parasphingorhabdus litoris TaxID=394733 RepID=A0ABN1A748_9SPHN|nr:flagellar motor switch protein FliM [Parasphingorhabdus litoris]